MFRKNTELTKLTEVKKDGYIMKNDKNGIEVKCTSKFVPFWEVKGFEIVDQRPIVLVS